MMSRKMFVEVRGIASSWSFEFNGDPANLPDWRADGLAVYEIEHSIPEWVVNAGLMVPWCRMENLIFGATIRRLWGRLRGIWRLRA